MEVTEWTVEHMSYLMRSQGDAGELGDIPEGNDDYLILKVTVGRPDLLIDNSDTNI